MSFISAFSFESMRITAIIRQLSLVSSIPKRDLPDAGIPADVAACIEADGAEVPADVALDIPTDLALCIEADSAAAEVFTFVAGLIGAGLPPDTGSKTVSGTAGACPRAAGADIRRKFCSRLFICITRSSAWRKPLILIPYCGLFGRLTVIIGLNVNPKAPRRVLCFFAAAFAAVASGIISNSAIATSLL